jgi:PST family polysaccharide transporter
MITLPIISRIIGPENYGAINYAFAFVSYFILFINAGFDLYGGRKIVACKEDKQQIEELFSRITFAKIYIAIATTIIFVISIVLIEQVRNEWLVNVFTYLLCIGWIINPSWLYNGMQDSRKYAIFSFLSKLLFSVAVVLAVQEKSDYIYHPLITSIAHVLVSFISLRYALKKYGLGFRYIKPKDVFHTLKENKMLSLIWWISNQASSTGIIIAGFMLLPNELGFYSAAFRLIVIIQSVVSMPLNTVLFPYIGSAFVQSYQEGMNRINKSFPYLVLLAFLMAVGTIIISKPLIILFFGDQFIESIVLLKILGIGLFFSAINSALGQQVLLNLKKDMMHIRFLIGGFIISIISLVLFINWYGVIGAAWAWPFAEALLFIAYCCYFCYQKIRIVNIAYYNPKFLYNNLFTLVRSRR